MSNGSRNFLRTVRNLLKMFPYMDIKTVFYYSETISICDAYLETDKVLSLRDVERIDRLMPGALLIASVTGKILIKVD